MSFQTTKVSVVFLFSMILSLTSSIAFASEGQEGGGKVSSLGWSMMKVQAVMDATKDHSAVIHKLEDISSISSEGVRDRFWVELVNDHNGKSELNCFIYSLKQVPQAVSIPKLKVTRIRTVDCSTQKD